MKTPAPALSHHFLFNTLHTISALVRADPPLAEEALDRLSALLRRVLAFGNEDLPLEEELDFVRAYVDLEHLRLGSRLSVVEDVDQHALSELVPPFTLQLLVENAIKHGIEPKSQAGIVWVIARVHDGALELEVGDNGNGADAERVSSSRGIGLSWLKERLNAHGNAEISIDTAPGAGFVTRIRLSGPIRGTAHH